MTGPVVMVENHHRRCRHICAAYDSALAVYGGAVLSTRVLPHWVGWLAIVYGLAGLGLVGVTGDADPFLHLVLPVVIGILLLLRRSQVSAVSQHEEGSRAASTTAV